MTSGRRPARAARSTRPAKSSSSTASTETSTPVRRVKPAKSLRAAATRSGSASPIHTSIADAFVAGLDPPPFEPAPPQPATRRQTSSAARRRTAARRRPYPLGLRDLDARDRARDHEPLDLGGALEDRVDLGVPVPALD